MKQKLWNGLTPKERYAYRIVLVMMAEGAMAIAMILNVLFPNEGPKLFDFLDPIQAGMMFVFIMSLYLYVIIVFVMESPMGVRWIGLFSQSKKKGK